MRELPIGYIDSGVGGLTVVKESLKQLPNESILFLGDNARCPYGPRSLDQVRAYIWQMTNFLREQGIKMLVVACNTGTAAAVDELKQVLKIPVVGVIASGSRAAIKQTRNNHIGVIGTQGTIQSQLYRRTILEKSDRVTVDSLACPSFVDLVESGVPHDVELSHHIDQVLAPLVDQGIDTLVLGCTHYPHLQAEIQKAVGLGVTLIDSGVETVNEVSMLLDYFNLSRSADEARANPPYQIYYTTGSVDSFKEMAGKWLKDPLLDVRGCQIRGEMINEITNSKP